MDAHPSKIMAKAGLEKAPGPLIERLSRGSQNLIDDGRRKIRPRSVQCIQPRSLAIIFAVDRPSCLAIAETLLVSPGQRRAPFTHYGFPSSADTRLNN
jgi:hypothetical protein